MATRLPLALLILGTICSHAEKYSILPLGFDGEYTAEIQVEGTSFELTLDTGSSNLVIPVQQCSKCTSPYACTSNLFSSECSCSSALPPDLVRPVTCRDFNCPSSIANLDCGPPDIAACACRQAGDEFPFLAPDQEVLVNSECYGDDSGFYGVVSKQRVTIGDFSVDAYFTAYSFMFQQYACGEAANVGILGLAYKSINTLGVPGPLAQMVEQHELEDVFSLCLIENFARQPIGRAGSFVVGGIGPSSMYSGDVHYAHVVNDEYYSVNVLGIAFDGQATGMQLSTYTAIVDSGTSDFVLPSAIHYLFSQHVQADTRIDITLQGKDSNTIVLTLYGHQLLTHMSVGEDDTIILGQPIFWNYHVVFNRKLNAVGFAVQGDCSSSSSKANIGTTSVLIICIVLLIAAGMFALWYVHKRNTMIATSYGMQQRLHNHDEL